MAISMIAHYQFKNAYPAFKISEHMPLGTLNKCAKFELDRINSFREKPFVIKKPTVFARNFYTGRVSQGNKTKTKFIRKSHIIMCTLGQIDFL